MNGLTLPGVYAGIASLREFKVYIGLRVQGPSTYIAELENVLSPALHGSLGHAAVCTAVDLACVRVRERERERERLFLLRFGALTWELPGACVALT